ncbi:hypothetical protein AVEN_222039-1 [Araneus ventricosus]|uniref:Uncharacterized protein n=1 Tax=Araneus ventricosus TaxID=182803 RepID=A0A4Y2UTT5_ARAVE|nr:hypothetical protein AVEN_222039-1 [Araneus ventricosus]
MMTSCSASFSCSGLLKELMEFVFTDQPVFNLERKDAILKDRLTWQSCFKCLHIKESDQAGCGKWVHSITPPAAHSPYFLFNSPNPDRTMPSAFNLQTEGSGTQRQVVKHLFQTAHIKVNLTSWVAVGEVGYTCYATSCLSTTLFSPTKPDPTRPTNLKS